MEAINEILHMKLHSALFYIAESRMHLTVFFAIVLVFVSILSVYLVQLQEVAKEKELETSRSEQYTPHTNDMLHYFQSVDEHDDEAAIAPDTTYDPSTGVVQCQYTSRVLPSFPTRPSPPISLVTQAGIKFGGMDIGMGTCARNSWFQSFWLRCNDSSGISGINSLNEAQVRDAFGNAINLDALVTIAPFVRGGGEWWNQVLKDCAGSEIEGELLQKWDDLIDWFSDNIGNAYFVSVDPSNDMLMGFSERLRCVVARVPGALVGVLGCVVIYTTQQRKATQDETSRIERETAQSYAASWM
jgi:hypothetical protein